jgi:hypothetical protein
LHSSNAKPTFFKIVSFRFPAIFLKRLTILQTLGFNQTFCFRFEAFVTMKKFCFNTGEDWSKHKLSELVKIFQNNLKKFPAVVDIPAIAGIHAIVVLCAVSSISTVTGVLAVPCIHAVKYDQESVSMKTVYNQNHAHIYTILPELLC